MKESSNLLKKALALVKPLPMAGIKNWNSLNNKKAGITIAEIKIIKLEIYLKKSINSRGIILKDVFVKGIDNSPIFIKIRTRKKLTNNTINTEALFDLFCS